MAYYFVKLFQEYGELFPAYKALVEGIVSFKRGELKRAELERLLYELYELFKRRRIQGREVGFVQFVYKTVLKIDLILYPEQKRLASEFDELRKKGLKSRNRRVSIKQNRLVELFNRHFRSFPGFSIIHYNHFSHIKKEIDFDRQKELHWIIYLHYVNFMVELKKLFMSRIRDGGAENDDDITLEDFFQKCLIDIEEEPERRMREISVNIALDFIELFSPAFDKMNAENIVSLKERMNEKLAIFDERSSEELGVNRRKASSIRSRTIYFRLVIPFVILLVLFTFARLRLLGEGLCRFSREVLPFNIPAIDRAVHIPLKYSFIRNNSMGKSELKQGDVVYSGDGVSIEYSLPFSCYLTIVCIDSKGIHNIPGFPESKEPILIERKLSARSSFVLDDTRGLELYYIFVSKKPFSFKKDIESSLLKLFPSGNTKGPAAQLYNLDLKDGISQYSIYFNHLEEM